jgi:zinc D-Ala-D-Ala carboxypeptidase
MGDLTKDFSRAEFACKGQNCCGASAPVDPRLVAGLQELREKTGTMLVISSGFRCRRHNAEVGGEAESQHTLGMAADVLCPSGWTSERLARMAEMVEVFRRGGIGIYPGRIHVDVREDGPARWRQ